MTKNRLGKFDSIRAIRKYELVSDVSAPTEIRSGKTAAATMYNTQTVKHVVKPQLEATINKAVEDT